MKIINAEFLLDLAYKNLINLNLLFFNKKISLILIKLLSLKVEFEEQFFESFNNFIKHV